MPSQGFRGTDLEAGPLEAAYERYERAKAQYTAFLLANPDLMAAYFELVKEISESTTSVREHLRHSSYPRIGPFKRTSSTKRVINAQLLLDAMPEAADLDGLFTHKVSVNREVLEGYVATGQIPHPVVEQATHQNENATVRIYGPKSPEEILKI